MANEFYYQTFANHLETNDFFHQDFKKNYGKPNFSKFSRKHSVGTRFCSAFEYIPYVNFHMVGTDFEVFAVVSFFPYIGRK